LKVEIDIIASIGASPTERALILAIIYVEIFKTGVVGTLIDNFQYHNQFLRMRVTNCPSIFVDQCQFNDPEN